MPIRPPNPRARVQRRLAKQIKTKSYERSPQLNRSRQIRHELLQAELANPTGRISDNEKARQASYASRGQADPRYEEAWSKHWYHNKEQPTSGNEADRYEEGDENDTDDEESE